MWNFFSYFSPITPAINTEENPNNINDAALRIEYYDVN
jgi:hypothetical protein